MKQISLQGAFVLLLIVAGLLAAYCVAPLPLTDYEEKDNEYEKHVLFFSEGERKVTFSVLATPFSENGTPSTRMVVSVWHADETRIDSMRLGIRFPEGGGGDVFMELPGANPFPPLHLERSLGSGGSDRVIDMPDTGIQGVGTMTFCFLVVPYSGQSGGTDLTVDIGAGLSETGFPWRRYEAQHRIPVEV